MNEKNLITYYNKFNEDKRLTRRHGIIEYRTATKYIHEYLNTMDNPKIIDIGAGTGAYSIPLANEGYDVTAVELIKHNLMTLRKNSDKVKTYLGNAIDLHKFKDNTFDIVLLFGPMYHLISNEDKIKALSEAKRIVKEDGLIFISYYMNEYAIITHGFMENTIKEDIKNILEIPDITLRSIKYMLYGMRNQLFWDGNKRTSMIIANKIMIMNGKGIILVKDDDLLEFNKLLTEYYTTGVDIKIIEFLYNKCVYGLE